ncbi:predicted protein [Botrytis cinerea T4]|uniref:Uncharacterized protein n=1 Tax=Botryotinia fuckeliana (strain T4) TaxID=999810 RepID=G2YE07_BOTF4|nr:predicted protein [Botrytis cinerea T4]
MPRGLMISLRECVCEATRIRLEEIINDLTTYYSLKRMPLSPFLLFKRPQPNIIRNPELFRNYRHCIF